MAERNGEISSRDFSKADEEAVWDVWLLWVWLVRRDAAGGRRHAGGKKIGMQLDSYWEEITEEFKTYVITRFPLLKVPLCWLFEDFIENFALNQLDELQTRDLRQLSTYSSLIRIILDHMFDIENKKIKRKNKRKKKKQ